MKPLAKIGVIAAVAAAGFILLQRLSEHSSAKASFSVGKTESHSNLSSGSSHSSSDNSTFNSRRVLFVSADTHPFSRRIATLLAQRLTNSPRIEQLEFTNAPPRLEGVASPDLFLRIDLANLQWSGLVPSTMKATVNASLGIAPWQSISYSSDSAAPPAIYFNWTATIEHETVFTGVRSDRYADAARSIVDDFAKAISNQLETLSVKFPPLPELPREFYGPYQPVVDFDFLKENHARRDGSYFGLFSHNDTFWTFQTGTNPVPVLERAVQQLTAAGWTAAEAAILNNVYPVVRLKQGEAQLEIFRVQNGANLSFGDEKGPIDFAAHYRKPFSEAERQAAIDRLFAAGAPLETVLPFENSFSEAQRQKFYALVEKSPVVSPRACVHLAENYLYRDQTNAALNLLRRAKALAVTLDDAAGVESSAEEVAKKISPKEKLKLEIPPEVFRELEFLEITNGPQHFEVERELGRPVLMFSAGERGWKSAALTVGPPLAGAYLWTLREAEDGSRSSSSSRFDLAGPAYQETFSLGKQRVNCTIRLLPDKQHLHYTIASGD